MNILKNYIDGAWISSASQETIDVINPATQEVLAKVPSGRDSGKDVEMAVRAASVAYKEWSKVPVIKRTQALYRLKTLMEENTEALAEIITNECGKTYGESVGEIQRAIENVEVACGTPMLMAGDIIEDITTGIDEMMIRQPLGVAACITPFNFPSMIVFWF